MGLSFIREHAGFTVGVPACSALNRSLRCETPCCDRTYTDGLESHLGWWVARMSHARLTRWLISKGVCGLNAGDRLHRELLTAVLADEEGSRVAVVDLTLLGRFYERFADHTVDVGRRTIFMATGSTPEGWAAARHAVERGLLAPPARQGRRPPACNSSITIGDHGG